MKKTHVVLKLVSVLGLSTGVAYAGSPYLVTLTDAPHYISEDTTGTVTWKVTNNSRITLVDNGAINWPNAIEPYYKGEGVCQERFTLLPNQSCLLMGRLIPKHANSNVIQGAPQLSGHPSTGGNTFKIPSSQEVNAEISDCKIPIAVTYNGAVPYNGGDNGSEPIEVILRGAQAGSFTITNLSGTSSYISCPFPAEDITVNWGLIEGDILSYDDSQCETVNAGGSCLINFKTVVEPYAAQDTVIFQGINTEAQMQTVAVLADGGLAPLYPGEIVINDANQSTCLNLQNITNSMLTNLSVGSLDPSKIHNTSLDASLFDSCSTVGSLVSGGICTLCYEATEQGYGADVVTISYQQDNIPEVLYTYVPVSVVDVPVEINAGEPVEVSPSATGSFDITNLGNFDLQNPIVSFTGVISGVTFDSSGCTSLPANSSCTVTYISGSSVSVINAYVQVIGTNLDGDRVREPIYDPSGPVCYTNQSFEHLQSIQFECTNPTSNTFTIGTTLTGDLANYGFVCNENDLTQCPYPTTCGSVLAPDASCLITVRTPTNYSQPLNNATTGTLKITLSTPSLTITSIAELKQEMVLYATGDFNTSDSTTDLNYISVYKDGSWATVDNGLNAIGHALALYADDLIVCGNFSNTSGVSDTLYVSRWNGAAYNALSTTSTYLNDNCYSVAATNGSDSKLLIGGRFTYVGTTYVGRLAEYNYLNSSDGLRPIDGIANFGISDGGKSAVYDLLPVMQNFVVGGFFDKTYPGTSLTNGEPNNIAYWNDTLHSWRGFDYGTLGLILFGNGSVYSLTEVGADYVLAGAFFDVVNRRFPYIYTVDYIAKYSTTSGFSRLGSGFNDFAFTVINHAVTSNSSQLCAGGEFTAGGQIFFAPKLMHVACFDGNNWNAVGRGLGDYYDRGVFSLVSHNNVLYAAGQFYNNRQGIKNIAAFQGQAWNSLGQLKKVVSSRERKAAVYDLLPVSQISLDSFGVVTP